MSKSYSGDPPQKVILIGNPADGFIVVGPFEELDDARRYIDTDPHKENMWIVDLHIPDDTTTGIEGIPDTPVQSLPTGVTNHD